jgi:hypothetical protein
MRTRSVRFCHGLLALGLVAASSPTRPAEVAAQSPPERGGSGTGGPAIQYWASERLSLTAGIGAGFWVIEDANDSGLGLNVGAQYALWQNGRHRLFLGLDYAPAFTDPETVHNLGVLFGWQLL